MSQPFVIDPPIAGSSGGLAELRATVRLDGTAYPIWFRTDLPAADVADGVEPFLSVCLLPAMLAGRPLKTEAPVSPVFMENLRRIQAHFLSWDRRLHPVEVQAPLRPPEPEPEDGRTATFFSGGVDSFHTLLTHRARIDDLVFVKGFDIPIRDPGLYASAHTAFREVAREMGKTLVRVETNVREFSDPRADWAHHQHGPALAAVAQWLAPRCRTVLIPGEYFPDEPAAWRRGSQPRTDPLFSTERVSIVHDGYQTTRVRKLEAIIREPCVQQSLRVCWENRGGAYNCGQCSKCLRNMAAIRALGRLDRCATFPPALDLKALARLPLDLGEWRLLIEEALELVTRAGTDRELARALRLCLARHRRRQWRTRAARWLRLRRH
jgi:hypothetical protein